MAHSENARRPLAITRLWLLAMLYALGGMSLAWSTPASPLSPAALMAEGQQAFQQGHIEQAAVHWREAVQRYAETAQGQAHGTALTHLAQAYEALGLYEQAEHSLQQALQLAEQSTDRIQIATVQGRLGNLYSTRQDSAAAERLLREALAHAAALQHSGLAAAILHNLGNLFMGQQKFPDALAMYQDSARLAQAAQQAGMAVRALAHAALAAERQGQPQTAKALLDAALARTTALPTSHDKAYEMLFIGRTYHRLVHMDAALALRAAEVFTTVVDMAQPLHDYRALSYAWGYLGRLYEESQRYQEAMQLTRRAVLAAQQTHVPEALYLWQWQTARLLYALGEVDAAITAYDRAISTVQSMRPAMLRAYGSVETSFRNALGPLYFEQVDVFLRRAAALEEHPQAAILPQYEYYLQRARDTVEQFKTAELRDYFRDSCVDAARPSVTALERVSPQALIVYPILLPDRTELLISLPTGLKRLRLPVTGAQLEQRVRIFRNALQDRDPLRYLRHAQSLYTWLIQPLEADLTTFSIQTIVFVPDGALRSLPLAALYDGQHFLMEKYALAITPSLTLTEPRPLPRDKLQVLAAGMASAVGDFPALPRVAEELQGIQRLYDGTVLLNGDFSAERLDRTIQRGQFGIIHIASHGQFTADASQSFLLTAQGKLTIEQFAQIVGRLRFREQPLELLTLSACETAQGDDRAALGLAGMAIKVGARSALATLWLVADDAAAVLMTEFYRALQSPNMSRARALQQAQHTLLLHPQYAEPYFWAPFLLINNWL